MASKTNSSKGVQILGGIAAVIVIGSLLYILLT